jgi:thiol:disulfide interchange protein
MRFPAFVDKALAALRARPRSWVAGAFAIFAAAAVFQTFNVEPRLAPGAAVVASANPPYRHDIGARTAVAKGLARAAKSGKMLMVTFGANWCPDCLTLHENLLDEETRAYADKHFEIVAVDVGDAEKSAEVKRDLGIDVKVIPTAVFYAPDGALIGDTLSGELKPSRHFTSREIRDFLREVVDYHRIVSPDQRQ